MARPHGGDAAGAFAAAVLSLAAADEHAHVPAQLQLPFNLARVLAIAKARPLCFDTDVVASRVLRGTRANAEPVQPRAKASALRKLANQGYTLQYHQPQRHDDGVARVVASLENQLGCLVGCNAYLTPPLTTGLAPHWDDVDVAVLQTEGRKRWLIHPPPPPGKDAPPRDHSGDLRVPDLPPALATVTLCPGDVLYLPRGTVHWATALEPTSATKRKRAGGDEDAGSDGAGSCHLTFSFRHRQAVGDFVAALANAATHAPPASPASATPAARLLRRSLPLKLGHMLAGRRAALNLGAALAAGLRRLADEVERGDGALLSNALDDLAGDFFESRLPPREEARGEPGLGASFRLVDRIAARHPGHQRVVRALSDAEGGWWDPEGGEGGEVLVLSSLQNRRERHMMAAVPDSAGSGSDDDDDDGGGGGGGGDGSDNDPAAFSPACLDALLRLFHPGRAADGTVAIADLAPGDPDTAAAAARALHRLGLVRRV